ncbi:MAG TPA: hypothetical protein VFR95_14210, partial [Gemmatimonadaceae bacterium]|nr:hypothetical protein [Gemmatimonadaceae bacterium]
EQGTGNREQGTGNREQGTGNREQGTGNYLVDVRTSYPVAPGYEARRTFMIPMPPTMSEIAAKEPMASLKIRIP